MSTSDEAAQAGGPDRPVCCGRRVGPRRARRTARSGRPHPRSSGTTTAGRTSTASTRSRPSTGRPASAASTCSPSSWTAPTPMGRRSCGRGASCGDLAQAVDGETARPAWDLLSLHQAFTGLAAYVSSGAGLIAVSPRTGRNAWRPIAESQAWLRPKSSGPAFSASVQSLVSGSPGPPVHAGGADHPNAGPGPSAAASPAAAGGPSPGVAGRAGRRRPGGGRGLAAR